MSGPVTYQTLGRGRGAYRVWAMQNQSLPPVVLSIHAGPMSFQEYFTPEEALQLADLLVVAAEQAGAKT